MSGGVHRQRLGSEGGGPGGSGGGYVVFAREKGASEHHGPRSETGLPWA